MNPGYISPSVKFAKIENFAVTQSGLALQAGCPGELFAELNQDSAELGIGSVVVGQVATEPALQNLDGCTVEFIYEAGGSDTFNIAEDCDVVDHGNGAFTIACDTQSIGFIGSYSLSVNCEGFGSDTSSDCNFN
jgi:hypothetical protein